MKSNSVLIEAYNAEKEKSEKKIPNLGQLCISIYGFDKLIEKKS